MTTPTEASLKIIDTVTAELVECAEPAPAPDVPLPPAPEGASQSQQIAEATIEQTGADPPPPVSPQQTSPSLHPPVERERHPIAQDPPQPTIASLVSELFQLKCLCAQLWDQVWWLSLPPERRADYEAQGFRDPIQQFYWPAREDR
jgi:hypothetical protein